MLKSPQFEVRSTPMLHVASVERSMAFYQHLGFVTVDTEGKREIEWARMHCSCGDVMFLRAEVHIDPLVQGFFFYLYTPDLPGLRQHLLKQGILVSEIQHPLYMPSGIVSLNDPDGYRIEIGHWSEAEHHAWLEKLKSRGEGWYS